MEAVVEAAQQAFAANGFDRTSVDEIAAASGVSKMTVYKYFPTKEALYSATVVSAIDRGLPAEALARLDPGEPAAALTQIGQAIVGLIRQDHVLGCHRAIIGSSSQYVGLAAQFYEVGPARIVSDVGKFLQAAQAAGSLDLPQVQQAADQFVSLFCNLDYWRSVLGMPKPGEQQDRALVKSNVDFFMRAYGPR